MIRYCSYCGKEFKIFPNDLRENNFCSVSCFGLFFRGKKRPNISLGKKLSFKLGKSIVWNRGKKLSEEHKRKQSETKKRLFKEGKLVPHNLGKSLSEEQKKKLSLIRVGIPNPKQSETMKRLYAEGKLIPYNLGKPMSEETKIKLSLAKRGKSNPKVSETLKRLFGEGKIKPSFLGKKHSVESRLKMSKSGKGRKVPEKFKIERSRIYKEMWKNKEYREMRIKNQLKKLFERPTSPEKTFINFIQKHKLPFSYVGDGRVLIGYKNPDFMGNNGNKEIIEVFYDYFKIRNYGSVAKYKERRNKIFGGFGFKTLFVDIKELTGEGWEEVLLEKINKFIS